MLDLSKIESGKMVYVDEKVDILEPSVEETVLILKGLKSRFEDHHGVHYSPESLRLAAELSERYITDRHLPDKAIDLIDEALSSVKLKTISKPVELDKMEKEIRTLEIEKAALKQEK